MKSANQVSLPLGDESAEPVLARESDNPGMFLAGVAGLLRETVQRFETISGGVTDAVRARSSMADRDMIVTLQAFDRLQQEFVAVADVLSRYSGALNDPSIGRERIEAEAIAAIAVSDLKHRLMHHLRAGQPVADEPLPDEEVF